MKVIPLKEMPRENISGRKPLELQFFVGKEFMRRIAIPHSDKRRNPVLQYELLPTLAHYPGRVIPDSVNPRSHDDSCLKSSVARDIETTIRETPEDMAIANRGITIVAESVEFNPHTQQIKIIIADPKNQGIADGGTTDAVIAKFQASIANGKRYLDLPQDEREKLLGECRVPLHVFVGLDDRDRISNLVQGRNTSRTVRSWSMADFKGEFDWIKDILEAADSPFKGKVGYEENSTEPLSILDVLAIVTLFHPIWDEDNDGSRAPVVGYSGKGRLDALLEKEGFAAGYRGLTDVFIDILKLHDHVYAGFEGAYARGIKAARLGRRSGVETRVGGVPFQLITGATSNYVIPSGFLYPLLASLRACLTYGKRGERKDQARWKVNPFEFFDAEGHKLVRALIDQVDEWGGSPQVAGKKTPVYIAVHQKAQLLLNRTDE